MPGDLKVCYFVNSGSEANDLAVLMARAYTSNYDIIALRNSYHGGNASGMGLTAHHTWKFNVPHSFGVHHAIAPDPYRGAWSRDQPDAGKNYAADVKNLLEHATSGQVAGFVAESIQGVGGCVVFPDGYLKHAYEHVRAAGGVCIADEVQAGLGRTGTHYWGFETQASCRISSRWQKASATVRRSAPSSPRPRSPRRSQRARTSTPSAVIQSSARKAKRCWK
jgi:alanine-glyoxylate transaminase/(R)-3-amino-2-methylpropionate-pyruvate transaminase